ncbi:chloramphenicol acetyltransferase [Intestinibacillus massiliensis]|nr:chloramphenicol acetyltransferase [Intestinibacillus massiliensis]
MSFQPIDPETWERRTHYEAYTTFLPLNWNVTVELDVTALLSAVRARGLRLYPVMLYLACTAIGQVPAFRMGYDEAGRLGYFDSVHPSYTVFHEDDHTFSDIWSAYDPDFDTFYQGAVRDMDTWGRCKGYKGRPDAPPNCCPMSMTPWLQFTSCSFDTFQPARMLRPILTFGRYFVRDGRTYMPFAICASHAVADGWHAARLVEELQRLADGAQKFLK